MDELVLNSSATYEERKVAGNGRKKDNKRWLQTTVFVAALIALLAVGIAWLALKASTIQAELQSAVQLVPQIKDDILNERKDEAMASVSVLRMHTSNAREAASDPIWNAASSVPWLGANFSAASEIARSADDVASLGVEPLVEVFETLDWNSLLPGPDGADLEPVRSSAARVTSATHAVKTSADRLAAIDATALIPQIADPLEQAKVQLETVQGTLEAAATASNLAPAMLGADQPRKYLLLIQNNAELRATGGIPGALAVLTADNGKLTLGEQTSAVELGPLVPSVAVDEEEKQIYSTRIGKFFQDINLTPNFPSSASIVKTMWERKKGVILDGVISIDPVALSYILDATGPVELDHPNIQAVAPDMPSQLSGKNVVKALLSDVYEKIREPADQDAYFAAVAGKIFAALSSGEGEAKPLMEGLARGVSERRVLIWSAHDEEQVKLANYTASGTISGPSVSPAQFGVYFNDGTGAKMDYYVKRAVQLVTKCPADGYSQVTVRVTSTNTAPADAATSLPAYVTGGGAFGIEPGSVQTNVVAYGPTQAHIEQATQDGNRMPFSSQVHAERPVGVVTNLLKPGQSSTVEFTFDKIVQHTKPELVVTPTTDAVKNVVMDTVIESCNSGR